MGADHPKTHQHIERKKGKTGQAHYVVAWAQITHGLNVARGDGGPLYGAATMSAHS